VPTAFRAVRRRPPASCFWPSVPSPSAATRSTSSDGVQADAPDFLAHWHLATNLLRRAVAAVIQVARRSHLRRPVSRWCRHSPSPSPKRPAPSRSPRRIEWQLSNQPKWTSWPEGPIRGLRKAAIRARCRAVRPLPTMLNA